MKTMLSLMLAALVLTTTQAYAEKAPQQRREIKSPPRIDRKKLTVRPVAPNSATTPTVARSPELTSDEVPRATPQVRPLTDDFGGVPYTTPNEISGDGVDADDIVRVNTARSGQPSGPNTRRDSDPMSLMALLLPAKIPPVAPGATPKQATNAEIIKALNNGTQVRAKGNASGNVGTNNSDAAGAADFQSTTQPFPDGLLLDARSPNPSLSSNNASGGVLRTDAQVAIDDPDNGVPSANPSAAQTANPNHASVTKPLNAPPALQEQMQSENRQ